MRSCRTHRRTPRTHTALSAVAAAALVAALAALPLSPAHADTDGGQTDDAPHHVTAANDHAMGSTIRDDSQQPWSVAGPPRLALAGGSVQGVDVSNNNGHIDWERVADAGIDFAIIKATEGTYFTDGKFDHNYIGSYDNGIIRGAYHFAIPSDSSGAAQARFFVNNGGGWSADGMTLPPMLDIEYNPYGATCYGLSDNQMVDWIADFRNTVQNLTGRYPMIYTTTDWWRTCTDNYGGFGSTSPLAIANWGADPEPLPNGWAYETIWQYSATGSVLGIGTTDRDAFNGSYHQLKVFATGSTRMAGPDRYGTAAEISEDAFSSSVDTAFVATGEEYADALSAGPAAAGEHAPILLTRSDRLPTETARALDELSLERIYVLGGRKAVSRRVVGEIRQYADQVTRLDGRNRFQTATAISKEFWNQPSVVYLADGDKFADALSGGPLAARRDAPILLSHTHRLPHVVARQLRKLDPSRVVLLGGRAALSERVERRVERAVPGVDVRRLAGRDRYATSAEIAHAGWNSSAKVYFATGLAFPDALAGVPAAAGDAAPLLLTRRDCLPDPVAEQVRLLDATAKVLLGGPNALGIHSATTHC